MPRPFLVLLLLAGTIGGFASGFASLHHHRWYHGDTCGWRAPAPPRPPTPLSPLAPPASTPAP